MEEWQPEIFNLSNGMRFVYLQTISPVAHLGVHVLAGSRLEDKNEEGLAHFLEHCIFKGTKKRKTFHVLSRLDSVGGELNAYTSKEEMVVYASFVKNHTERAMELLADITLNANFPAKEIEKEKEIVLDEINSYLDSPGDKIFDDFESYLFEGHALGTNILGTPETVSAFTKKDLEKYLEKHFHADNMVVSFVGNVPSQKVLKWIEKYFANCPKRQKEIVKEFTGCHQFHKIEKEANYQVHAVVGGYAPGYDEEDRKCMFLLTNILGGPALNSKLNLSIREKYGYSYNIESSYTPYGEIGFWSVYLGTDTKYLKKSLKVLYKELDSLRTKKLSDKYLKMAKDQYKGHMALAMESHSGLMLSLGKSVLLFNQVDSIFEMNQSIEKVTADDIQRIANKYFAKEKISELIFEIVE
jgi:predicted Zn-dependent peptidase|tara:strand:- start:58507 stop:59742 length:1236 start_codon:yes stop_codon:yes gene_type:complete